MKNNNPQELKPVYIYETNYHANDEVNLMDVVLVLIRRKVMVTSIFIISIVLAIIFTLFVPKTFTYNSTIEIGNHVIDNSIHLIEPTQSLIAKLNHGYITQALREHKNLHPDDTEKYQIKATNPTNSNGIVLLEIKGHKDQSAAIINLLQTITQTVIRDHSGIYQNLKENLETSLNKTTQRITPLNNGGNEISDTAEVLTIIESLKFQLANLRNTREAFSAFRSIEPAGMNGAAIITISAFVGLLLGVFTAFFTEFVTRLKASQDDSIIESDNIKK